MMQTKITNKYEGIDIDTMNIQDLQNFKKSLECDISWTEHDLYHLSNSENYDEKLDEMNMCKNLLDQVIKKLTF
jgi:hypothetical protein